MYENTIDGRFLDLQKNNIIQPFYCSLGSLHESFFLLLLHSIVLKVSQWAAELAAMYFLARMRLGDTELI